MKLWQAAYWGEAAVGFHWFAIMFSLERCFRGSDKKTHQLMCVCVCVCLGFCFLNTPPPSTPPPGITLTFPLPVKLLRSTLVLLFPSSSLLLSLYSSFLLPSTFGDVSRAFYSSPRRLSLHSVTPSRSPSHCPFFTAAHPPTPPPLRHYSMCKMNFTRRNLLLTRRTSAG